MARTLSIAQIPHILIFPLKHQEKLVTKWIRNFPLWLSCDIAD